MTNRTNIRPYSAGVTLKTVKKPRLRRFDLTFDAPPPPTPEGINNGIRPHGGYRGMRPLPPGQFSFDKDEIYRHEIEDEYQILVNNENTEVHGAPYWVSEVQREITNSGESPLFTNHLLSSGKFEQEQGVVNFERALLHNNTRRRIAPRRRHLNDRKEYYRPNSTHQYLSATDLRNLHENEENMVRYGRPTRTTLLRARQRTSSAPVNAYDVRRENNRRTEEARNNANIQPLKDLFERDYIRVSYSYLNIFASEGESVHSFLTGARYNRAHLVDSKGLALYGVYMPRGHPSDCFITGPRRFKDVGDDIPSAPPDSPRSDLEDTPTPVNVSRPESSKRVNQSPSSRSSSGKLGTRRTTSRPQSLKKPPSRISSSGSHPRSAKDQSHIATAVNGVHPLPPKSPEKKELPLPDEVTMAMPDHINKGKQGVYVTLKGQKIIESVDSKLPRVTGVSLPKIKKSRDYVEEMLYVNQPPPTPVDASAVSVDKNRYDTSYADGRSIHQIEEKVTEEEAVTDRTNQQINETEQNKTDEKPKESADTINEEISDKKNSPISKVTERENVMTEKKTLEIGPMKKVNFEDVDKAEVERKPDGRKQGEDDNNVKKKADNVVFFITEENESGKNTARSDKADSKTIQSETDVNNENNAYENNDITSANNENTNGNDIEQKTVDDVIKVEISESEKKTEDNKTKELNSGEEKPVTSAEYPFNDGS